MLAAASDRSVIEVFPKRSVLLEVDQHGGLVAPLIDQELYAFHVDHLAQTNFKSCAAIGKTSCDPSLQTAIFWMNPFKRRENDSTHFQSQSEGSPRLGIVLHQPSARFLEL